MNYSATSPTHHFSHLPHYRPQPTHNTTDTVQLPRTRYQPGVCCKLTISSCYAASRVTEDPDFLCHDASYSSNSSLAYRESCPQIVQCCPCAASPHSFPQ